MQVIVDAATGLVMREHYDDPDRRAEWVEFAEHSTLPSDRLTWTWPVRTVAEVRAEREREHEQDRARCLEWFRDHVCAAPLDIRGPVTVWMQDGAPQVDSRHL